MDYTTFGRTGLKVSVMGLGCGGPSRIGQSSDKSEAEAPPNSCFASRFPIGACTQRLLAPRVLNTWRTIFKPLRPVAYF
jgi:hypothetical protein